jgi:hypothetical protein
MSQPQPDAVSLQDAYAAALVEIARLQERVILGQAFITALKRGEVDGPQSNGTSGDGGRNDPPHHFLD